MDAIWTLESELILAVQSALTGLTGIMQAITLLGSEDFFVFIMPILYWCVDTGLGLRIGAILLLSTNINYMFKAFLNSPRPFWYDPRLKAMSVETSFGMPSGHAMNTTSVWGLAARLFNRSWFNIVAFAVIVLVGVSRIVLGMHFISDVLAGWLVGLLVLVLFIVVEKRVTPWIKAQNFRTLALVVLASTAAMILLGYLPHILGSRIELPQEWIDNALKAGVDAYPHPYETSGIFTAAGTWLGMGLGAAWLFTHGGLPKTSSPIRQLLRYLVGLAGLIVFWMGLGAVFPDGETVLPLLLRLFRYTLVGLWIGAGAPWLFMKLKLAERV